MQNEVSHSISDLLAAAREDVERMPAAARARLAERLSLVGVATVAGSTAAGASAGLARSVSPSWFKSPWFAAGIALPVGALMGAAGHAWLAPLPSSPTPTELRRPERELVVAQQPSVAPPLVDEPTQQKTPPEPEEQRPAASRRVGTAPAAVPSGGSPRDRDLVWLEQARTKLSEGDANASLELLRGHQARYPSSALTQEREALTIRALFAAGRAREATRSAELFLERYPHSLLRESVARAAGKIP